ncbi:hypothetical protein BD410DRAFT_794014 [Rickenella mellea]|uniref:F-box domain-containing protein n=1 Tax=Rickenella mellea TaxID=50990 RepID=A0A4Y7PRC3_9AGAM|nr:hypothetical protein BD410DRAFT_794014 [Rickenella mellea]
MLETHCRTLALEAGIKRLPDEVLSMIFELGHLGATPCAFALRVSHVCRRFRGIALSTPCLWTKVSPGYSLDQTHSFLSRSGQVGLDICIPWRASLGGEDKYDDILRILGSESHRWTCLRIASNDAEPRLRKLGITNFPCLLNLQCDSDAGTPSFNTPSLQRINGTLCDPDVKFAYQSQLSILDVIFYERRNIEVVEFSRAVHEMRNLREFSLTMEACDCVEMPPNTAKPEFERHSVLIDKISFSIKNGCDYKIVGPVYSAVSFLFATTFTLSLEHLEGGDTIDFLYDCEQNMVPYGSSVIINITNLSDPNLEWSWFYLLDTLTQTCRIAHTIHFNAPSARFVSPSEPFDSESGYHTLRNLRFECCDRLSPHDIMKLVNQFMLNEDLDDHESIQSLGIFSCRGIREQFLINLGERLSGKLEWTI